MAVAQIAFSLWAYARARCLLFLRGGTGEAAVAVKGRSSTHGLQSRREYKGRQNQEVEKKSQHKLSDL